MVLPTTADFQVPWRIAFPSEAQAANEGSRSPVGRLDVCLEAMQLEHPERLGDHEPHSLRHVPPTSVGHESVVSKVGAPKWASHNLAHVHDADHLTGGPQEGEKALMRILATPREIGAEQPWR